MLYKNEDFTGEIPDDFILDITKIPGSSDEITLIAIDYYAKKIQDPNLAQPLKAIANAYVANLTEYYNMTNFDSQNLRDILPFLSKSHRFIESKSSTEIDIESTARIKSFYSVYKKILDISVESITTNMPIPNNCFLHDIYATRDILYPRHDMRNNPQAFYRLTYKTILEYMEYIDKLSEQDSRYGLVPLSEKEHRNLIRPQLVKYGAGEISVPENDFIGYALNEKNIPSAYRYLADIDNMTPAALCNELLKLKQCDMSNPETYSDLLLYKMITAQTQKEYLFKLRNHFETILLNDFSKKSNEMYKDFCSLPLDEFLYNYEHSLNSYNTNCCKLITHIDSITSKNALPTTSFPEFSTTSFMNEVIQKFNQLQQEQNDTILQRMQALQNLDLSNFPANLATARKIKYFSLCGKDHMQFPKGNGYQSFHIRIQTPYGKIEKQIRTEDQHIVAEKGLASHSKSYKPNVKSSFHRLKVPAPLSPKRDEHGDLIAPTELGVLPFELAVAQYYGVPFSNYASGKTLEEFKSQFATKDEFDQALLDLSPSTTGNKFWDFVLDILQKRNNRIYNASTSITIPTKPSELLQTIPEDIAAYPKKPNQSTRKIIALEAPKALSTDDSDPHDDGNR